MGGGPCILGCGCGRQLRGKCWVLSGVGGQTQEQLCDLLSLEAGRPASDGRSRGLLTIITLALRGAEVLQKPRVAEETQCDLGVSHWWRLETGH